MVATLIWTIRRFTYYNCICLEGYVEHMNQCITNCPPAFKKVNDACEECTGDCDEGMVVAIIMKSVFTSDVVFILS